MKVGDPRVFHLIGTQQLECEKAVKYLKDLMNTDDVKWLFLLLLTGGGILRKDDEKTEELIKRAGFTNEDGDLSQWHQGWGHSGSGRISEIHKKIEQISQWK